MLIQCRQTDNNAIIHSNSRWTNFFKEPITIKKGSKITTNSCYISTPISGQSIFIQSGVNDTFNIELVFLAGPTAAPYEAYTQYPQSNEVSMLCWYNSITQDSRPYTKNIGVVVPEGYYSIDALAVQINKYLAQTTYDEIAHGALFTNNCMINAIKGTINPENADEQLIVVKDYNILDYPNPQNNLFELPWSNSNPDGTILGANDITLSYDQNLNRYSFTYLHSPIVAPTNLQPGAGFIDGIWSTCYSNISISLLHDGVQGSGWESLGFDPETQCDTHFWGDYFPNYESGGQSYNLNFGTTTANTDCSMQGKTYIGLDDNNNNTVYYQFGSTNLSAKSLPTLIKNPYYLINSNFNDETNLSTENGDVSCTAIVNNTYASSNFINGITGQFTIGVYEDLVITSITNTINLPDNSLADGGIQDPLNVIIYEVIPPEQV